MKTLEIIKLQRTDVPVEYQKEEGCVAFQLVNFKINFFGSITESTHDTKILKDGRQIVICGCGYIPNGYELTN
jgi:hypothetical protein